MTGRAGGRGRIWASGLALAAQLLFVFTAPAFAASRYDPRLRFRSLKTASFTIHYHQGEERAARRLAALAEDVRAELQARLRLKAPTHAHVVLVDQTDVSNGWTSPVPYPVIEIALVPPPPASTLGHHDDWLRLVLTHEYAHAMHIDQVGGLMRGIRWVFGRQEASFPNLAVPAWQIEGLATWAEGAGGGIGRAHAADVAAMTRARSAASPPGLGLLGGGLVDWPWGYGPYFYGGQFYEYLAARGGDESVGELARQTARRLPYFGGGAFDQVYGASGAALWREFIDARAAADTAVNADVADVGRRLTTQGYLATAPRFVPGRASPDASDPAAAILVSRTTPHGFAAIWEIDPRQPEPRKIVDRYDGEGLAFYGDWLVYDRLEFDGPVARFSDLWATRRRDGRTVRLTRGARMSDPDVSPDGGTLAAVVSEAGDRVLVVHPLDRAADGVPRLAGQAVSRVAEPGCVFATPRWSPDGRMIAAVRHCIGRLPGVVLIRPGERAVTPIAPRDGARDVTPAWTPDGRWLIFASDRDGAFALYAVSLGPDSGAAGEARLVLRARGGASWPTVDATGSRVAYLSATAGGLDLFVAPLALPTATAAVSEAPTHAPVEVPAPARSGDDARVADSPYSPWSTLWPRGWLPLLDIDGDRVDVGAAIRGSDALGYHAYWAEATAAVSRDTASPGFPVAGGADWLVSYSYDRWRPTLFASASSESGMLRVRVPGGEPLLSAWQRTHELAAGVLWPLRRTRWSQSLLLAADFQTRVIGLPDRDVTRRRHAVRGGWVFNSARQFGYSISPESGARIGVAAERVEPALGADGASTTWTADARAYLPGGFPHAVVAIRGAAGVSSGDAIVRRTFTNGGARAAGALLSFGDDVVALLRGVDAQALAGTAAATLNVDYRFPLARVERGAGLWPLFVNAVHGAVFADAGSVGPSPGRLAAPAWSVGAEGAALLTIGYGLRVSLAGGLAFTHQPGRAPRPGRVAFFVRTGYAF